MFDINRWQEVYHVLRSNKLRTFLTAFGVFWGILLLILMLGAGIGMQNGIIEGFKNFATNSSFIWSQTTSKPYAGFQRGRNWNFTNDDMVAISSNINDIEILSPRISTGWGSKTIILRGTVSASFTVNGDYPNYDKVDPNIMVYGRWLNDLDIAGSRKVVILGERCYERLFKEGGNPVGQYIQINGMFFQVIGVAKPSNPNINIGSNKKETLTIPFSTLQRTFNMGNQVHYFAVTSKKDVKVSVIEEKIMRFLKKRHSIAPDDQEALGHINIETEFSKINGLFLGVGFLIWVVGLGTLISGVIGVSNIMLVIIKERTQEIGIKRALGATPRNIIGQIVTESIVLTSVAGYLGLCFGVGILYLINLATQNATGDNIFRDPQVSFTIGMLSLAVLVLTGLLAGLYPAYKAVSIKPIDAIRTEN
jgi:putative ABC transport system permease protein